MINQDAYVHVTCQSHMYTCPTAHTPHQLEQSPADMQGSWFHEVVSIPIHVLRLDTIGNETRQARQHVSSHQQFSVCVDGLRRGIKLCVVQSTKVHV